jgi:glycosyltransferase involved in cell wall biosynthesis
VVTNVRTPGLAGARNTGIEQGDAPLVAFCDDDDTWLPGKLLAQVEALRADPGAVLASCGVRVRYEDTSTDRVLPHDRVELRDLLRSRLMELHPSTFLFRRAAMVDGFGMVAEDIPGSYAEDYELLLRAARAGRILSVPVVGTQILWHARSYFTARWVTITEALTWLLARYPEFRVVPRGHARILGQIAFATAAQGHRRPALSHAFRTMRASMREPRAYLALMVATGLLSADRVLAVLQRRGQSV